MSYRYVIIGLIDSLSQLNLDLKSTNFLPKKVYMN